LVHGAVAGWYPYPFLNVLVHGYASVLGNAVLVTALMFGVAFLYRRGDRRLGVAPVGTAEVGTAQVGTADVGTAEVELVGSWQVVRIGATPLQRVELDFAADRTVSGSTGVNRLHGGYEVRDGTLVVGRLITTLMAGPPAAMAAEARLLAVLAGPLRLVGTDAGLCLVAEPDTLVLEPAPGPTL
ncbi:MAG: META domain-containing protein, partial [Actinomycetes bacterium]